MVLADALESVGVHVVYNFKFPGLSRCDSSDMQFVFTTYWFKCLRTWTTAIYGGETVRDGIHSRTSAIQSREISIKVVNVDIPALRDSMESCSRLGTCRLTQFHDFTRSHSHNRWS